MNRVVLIVLDGVGAGWQHDAAKYGDKGADTLGHVIAQEHPDICLLYTSRPPRQRRAL